MNVRSLSVAMVAAAGVMAGAPACAPSGPQRLEIAEYTDDFAMKVSWDPQPATAREPILFRVVVRDKKTGEPIENGEGRIFANNAGGQSTYDSFVPTKESGTYTGKLRFITAGEWAVGIQFRRDSTQKKLQRPSSDLRLTVGNERESSNGKTP